MDHETLKAKIESVTVTGLAWNPETRTHDDVNVSPKVLLVDGVVLVDGESENGILFCDYYGEFHDGNPWICPELIALASELGGFWDWQNPGAIYLDI